LKNQVMPLPRYHRQTLLPEIGEKGQQRLASSRVLLVGCGALGTTIADQLVRAGVGHLTIVDRDIVELTNLQRQTLFDESDAAGELPKAIAAANRLRAINSSVESSPIVADVHPGNIEDLIKPGFDLLLDGTDNVQTRYLINDVSVKHRIPWIYGAAVAAEGRVMSIVPSRTPCLRCIFPTPPGPQELQTCDTAGVLGMGASIVANYQAIEAIKILTGASPAPSLMRFDFWTPRMHSVAIANAKVADCPCCNEHRFEYLDSPIDNGASLCGRNAVQIRPAKPVALNLDRMVERLMTAGQVQRTPYFIRCQLNDPANVGFTLFPDGRTLVHGLTDIGRAKSLYSRFVGS
jgi:molybdopterin/thiamine biosynthesis adenylyltransferase